MKRSVLFAFSGLLAATAHGQTIYKCSNGKGGNTYQQTPCANAAKTKTVYSYTPVPDAPRDYGQFDRQPRGGSYGEEQAWQQPSPGSQATAGLIRNQGEEDRRREIAESSYINRRLTKRPIRTVPDPSEGIGQPTRVLDERTMLERNDMIKVAPNRVWDPRTGKYHNTHP